MTDDNENTTQEAVEQESGEDGRSYIQAPKLMRIASMTRAMLDELRQTPLDEAGRRRLAEIHDRSLEEMHEVLSEDLQEELAEMFVPLSSEDASEGELRLAQAQLAGWLEGLFAGIQATLWSQQAAAANQLQEMRQRAIEAQSRGASRDTPGQYL